MHKSLLYSRILQFSIVLSFLLPFFLVGCESKSEESAAALDSIATDTTVIVSPDTLYPKDSLTNLSADETKESIRSSSINQDVYALRKNKEVLDTNSLSIRIQKNNPWLSIFLYGSGDQCLFCITFTGAALVLDIIDYFTSLSIAFAFILVLIGILIKYLDKSARRTQILHNSLAAICLYLYVPSIQYEILWGYWVCITLLLLTIAFDLYCLRLSKVKLSD